MREAFPHGRYELEIGEESFGLADYQRFLAAEAPSIAAFKATQQAAFEAERQRWAEQGASAPEAEANDTSTAASAHAGAEIVESHVHGSVWQLRVLVGKRVQRGEVLLVLESMKMEIAIEAPSAGVVLELLVVEGRAVAPGQPLVALRTGDA